MREETAWAIVAMTIAFVVSIWLFCSYQETKTAMENGYSQQVEKGTGYSTHIIWVKK